MGLALDPSVAVSYKNPAQRARVITEHWAAANLFCPACTADYLAPLPPNTAVADYLCLNCTAKCQLKSKSGSFGRSVADSAYHPKILAIQNGQVPNYIFLLIMHEHLYVFRKPQPGEKTRSYHESMRWW